MRYTARVSRIGFFLAGISAFEFAKNSLVSNKARFWQRLTPNSNAERRLRKPSILEILSV